MSDKVSVEARSRGRHEAASPEQDAIPQVTGILSDGVPNEEELGILVGRHELCYVRGA